MIAKAGLYARLFSVAAIVLVLDQGTKQLALDNLREGPVPIIPGILSLRLTFNSGGAFGFLQGLPGLFLVTSIAIIGVILVWAGRLEDGTFVVPLGLVLGGGSGNLFDRVLRDLGGQVVDFIDLHFWPVFNLADSAIVIGVLTIALAGARHRPARAEV